MEEREELLDRMRAKTNRTRVPARGDSLLPDSGKPEIHDRPIASGQITLDDLRARVEAIPPTVRRSGIVLDEEISDQLNNYCRSKKITLEVLIEAVWTELIEPRKLPELLNDIEAESHRRYVARKEAGGLRRTLALVMDIDKK